MHIRIALLGATAIGMLMATGALADSNTLYLTQTGGTNSASVAQSSVNGGNSGGTLSDQITQNGDNNALTLTQSFGSSIGVPASNGTDYYQPTHDPRVGLIYPDGVDQIGNRNSIDATQVRAFLLRLQQTAVSSTASVKNSAVINQTGIVSNGAQIGSIEQHYTDATGAAAGNVATVTQTQIGDTHRDVIQSIYQNGTNNSVTATQSTGFQALVSMVQDGANNTAVASESGTNNFIAELRQVGNGNSGSINLTGTYNGANNLLANLAPSHVPSLGTYNYAYNTGAVGSSLIQQGSSNQASLLISGTGNMYGISQIGSSNQAIGVTIGGNYNDFGIYQSSDGNVANVLGSISGNHNDIGLKQVGLNNTVNLTDTASNSRVWVKEQGNYNLVSVTQSGQWSIASADIVGNSNTLNLKQAGGSTTGNTLTVTIAGSNNNNGSVALSGAALTAQSAIAADLVSSVSPGDLFQNGDGNSLSVSITGSTNSFEMYQHGNGNSITHTSSGGASNQAVIAQIGNSNSSVTTQTGSFNIVGVTQ